MKHFDNPSYQRKNFIKYSPKMHPDCSATRKRDSSNTMERHPITKALLFKMEHGGTISYTQSTAQHSALVNASNHPYQNISTQLRTDRSNPISGHMTSPFQQSNEATTNDNLSVERPKLYESQGSTRDNLPQFIEKSQKVPHKVAMRDFHNRVDMSQTNPHPKHLASPARNKGSQRTFMTSPYKQHQKEAFQRMRYNMDQHLMIEKDMPKQYRRSNVKGSQRTAGDSGSLQIANSGSQVINSSSAARHSLISNIKNNKLFESVATQPTTSISQNINPHQQSSIVIMGGGQVSVDGGGMDGDQPINKKQTPAI